MMEMGRRLDRRNFFRLTGAAMMLGTGVGLAAEEKQEDISPAENLMREHGVLRRVVLVYREAVRRLDAHEELPPEPVAAGARIIREFIEDYHEKLEEDHLFPRFRKAGKLVALVDVLQQQHQAGRRLTDLTRQLAAAGKDGARLADPLRRFIRLYEPHAAREDTVLFPALHTLVTPHEYDALGDEFEKKEHELFGGGGFEKMVARVAAIEKTLGIHDLAQFTRKE